MTDLRGPILRRVIFALAKQDNDRKLLVHQDAIRALFLLNSTDISVAGTGYQWFRGASHR
jgi:hypothetical protein